MKQTLEFVSNCNIRNVVYCLWRPCNLPYIGQTQQPVKARIGQHRSRIRRSVVNDPLVTHFAEQNHTADYIRWQIIDQAIIPERGGDLTQILQ